jgi:hypothetical protein
LTRHCLEVTKTNKAIPGLKDHGKIVPDTGDIEGDKTILDPNWPAWVEARICELDESNWLYNLIQLIPDLLDSSLELMSTTKAIPGLKDHRRVVPNTTEEDKTIPDRYWPVWVEARIGCLTRRVELVVRLQSASTGIDRTVSK